MNRAFPPFIRLHIHDNMGLSGNDIAVEHRVASFNTNTPIALSRPSLSLSLVFPPVAPLYSYSYEYSKRWRGMGADDAWG